MGRYPRGCRSVRSGWCWTIRASTPRSGRRSVRSRRSSGRGDSYDNAVAESTIGLCKTEFIHRRGLWRGVEDLELATLDYMHWFNHQRLNGAADNMPPVEFEAAYYRHNPKAIAA